MILITSYLSTSVQKLKHSLTHTATKCGAVYLAIIPLGAWAIIQYGSVRLVAYRTIASPGNRPRTAKVLTFFICVRPGVQFFFGGINELHARTAVLAVDGSDASIVPFIKIPDDMGAGYPYALLLFMSNLTFTISPFVFARASFPDL